jgi:membrane-bound ClpP family serine protease
MVRLPGTISRSAAARSSSVVTGVAMDLYPHVVEWEYDQPMGIVITLIIVGIILLFFGIFVKAAEFLLWIGIILLVISVIMWVLRGVRNRA